MNRWGVKTVCESRETSLGVGFFVFLNPPQSYFHAASSADGLPSRRTRRLCVGALFCQRQSLTREDDHSVHSRSV